MADDPTRNDATAHVVEIASPTMAVSLVHRGAMPAIAAIVSDRLDFVAAAAERPVPHAGLDAPAEAGLIAEAAVGFAGRPGLSGCRPDGTAWCPRFAMVSVEACGDRVVFRLDDSIAQLGLTLELVVDDVLTVSATLHNHGDTDYMVERLAPSIPVPSHLVDLVTFSGRWCREFQPDRSAFVGTTLVENRTGRTSHARLPAAFACTHDAGDERGEALAVQLAWSGNHTIVAEQLPDGRRHVQVGELLEPGEVSLEPGSSYRAPDVIVARSVRGFNGVSSAFHGSVRRHSPSSGPRPVALNTWEAVYFDHSFETLRELADVAADVGVERFVLDDGWFGGRRHDAAGLGDWWVSEAVWPSGLAPIVDHVTGLGMEFGLWVEPEMVNPDSDLYRAHPDWALTTDGYDAPLGRNQLVLDFGRRDVRDHLFHALDALLTEYDISALKWDMNRDIVQGSRRGRAGAHGHVLGVYDVLDRVRAAHPEVEIESCASGGGRADAAILRRTARIWTSDCNDAVERQLIQRGFSMLFPPEVMGAHIGPERAHTTRRRHDLAFRATTALFGHLGIEWNLLSVDDSARRQVAAAVGLHRRLRPLLHGGDVVRVDHPDTAALVHGVVAPDRDHAIFAYVQLTPSAATMPLPMRLPGLDAHRRYRVEVVDDLGAPTQAGRVAPPWFLAGAIDQIGGAQLADVGVSLPIVHPESAVLLEVRAT